MSEKIKLNIVGLTFSHSQRGAYALILNEENGQRRLPIIIGGFEAQAIAIELEGMKPPRPLTHDLFRNLADEFDIQIDEVVITELIDGIFKSKIVCSSNNKIIEIDSRTSDAIAIGIRFKAPIYTYENILNDAGIILEEKDVESLLDPKVDDDFPEEDDTEFNEDVNLTPEEKYESYSTVELNEMMIQSVENEEYEKASEIRDEIQRRKESLE